MAVIEDITYDRAGNVTARTIIPEGSPEWIARQPKPQTLTKFGFLSLFTPQEQAAAIALKPTTLAVFWLNYEAANSFERDHPATVGGLNALVSAEVIDATRKAAILAAWPTM